jgi:inner membrane protein
MNSITQAAVVGASLAEARRMEWFTSGRLPRPSINPDALPLLWQCTTGTLPALCLADLRVPEPGQGC